jgi:hypothetical protein
MEDLHMKHLCFFLTLIVSLVGYASARPQQTGDTSSPTSEDIIDGSKNPELIPDLSAYRLWLLAVSADVQDQPDRSANARQSHLRAAHILDADISEADTILLQFRSNYDQLLANYNQSVAAGEQPSLSLFVTQRDLLVQATVGALQSKMAPASFSSLQAHIQAEKAHMKIAKEVK